MLLHFFSIASPWHVLESMISSDPRIENILADDGNKIVVSRCLLTTVPKFSPNSQNAGSKKASIKNHSTRNANQT